MIRDLVAYLVADSTLNTLLGAGNGNTKYFPQNVDPEGELSPYVVYGYQSDGSADDLMDEALVRLQVIGEDYEDLLTIIERITVLLDVWDDAKAITSAAYRIKYCKKVSGSDTYDEGTRRHELTRLFLVKFKRISGG